MPYYQFNTSNQTFKSLFSTDTVQNLSYIVTHETSKGTTLQVHGESDKIKGHLIHFSDLDKVMVEYFGESQQSILVECHKLMLSPHEQALWVNYMIDHTLSSHVHQVTTLLLNKKIAQASEKIKELLKP